MADFKYKHVAQQLRERIEEGVYAPGDKIPTENELCEDLGVGRQTLRKAVSMLEEAGELKRIQGSGTYVCKKEKQEREAVFLKSSNSKTITLLMMNCTNYVFVNIMRGISDYVSQYGYFLNTVITDGDYEKEKTALENILADPPAGLIYEPNCSAILSVNQYLIDQIASQIPCLLLHVNDIGKVQALSLKDNIGTKKAAEHLIALGHKKIGSIYVLDEITGQNRYVGYRQALRENGLEHKDHYSIWLEHDKKNNIFEKNGNLSLENMLKDVTAIMCHDDRVACMLIWYLREKGIRVPDDISVVGYDDSEYARMETPLTTISHPKEEYGTMAAKALIKIIQSVEQIDMNEYVVEPELIIRKSTASPKTL